MTMLLDEKALRDRIYKVHSGQRQKAKPRYYKSGKRKGHILRAGLDKLPYTSEDLWQLALRQVGMGALRCPYCIAIGRPVNVIDLRSCVFDHKIPIDKLASHEDLLRIHSIDNLVAVCEDCNTWKGSLSYEFFVEMMQLAERYGERDRAYLCACLKTHGKVMRGWIDKGKKGVESPDIDTPKTLSLELTGRVKGISAAPEKW